MTLSLIDPLSDSLKFAGAKFGADSMQLMTKTEIDLRNAEKVIE